MKTPRLQWIARHWTAVFLATIYAATCSALGAVALAGLFPQYLRASRIAVSAFFVTEVGMCLLMLYWARN